MKTKNLLLATAFILALTGYIYNDWAVMFSGVAVLFAYIINKI